ncbi:492_t:CDS:1, partial [Racocetra persica]
QPNKLYKLEAKLVCTACYKTYYEVLDPEDPRSQKYYNTGLGRGTLV